LNFVKIKFSSLLKGIIFFSKGTLTYYFHFNNYTGSLNVRPNVPNIPDVPVANVIPNVIVEDLDSDNESVTSTSTNLGYPVRYTEVEL
jgi:hypothetical protein